MAPNASNEQVMPHRLQQDDDDIDAENPAPPPATSALESSSSSSFNQDIFETFHKSAVTRVINEAGAFSPAIVAVEVWSLDEVENRLILEKGGCWTCPSLQQESSGGGTGVGEAGDIQMLSLPHKEGASIAPGVDLAGNLWSAANSSSSSSGTSTTARTSNRRRRSSLHWHNLASLLQDPDTAKGDYKGHHENGSNRMAQYAALGIDRAAGVPFCHDGHEGIVVYMSTSDTHHENITKHDAHDTFLHRVTHLLGTTVALRSAKHGLLKKNHHYSSNSKPWKMPLVGNDGIITQSCCCGGGGNGNACCKKLTRVIHKAKGGGMPVPPPMSTQQAIWTWFGSFLTLLVLSGINHALVHNTVEEKLLIGPFGALMTLQYGLTAAPASQPRNAILGQIVSGAIAVSVRQIPGLPPWLHQALGPAFSIAAMVRLGIPHPPAGAHAVLYASGNHQWTLYGIVVMCTVVSCLCSTLINNFSEKRQYPIYWTGPLVNALMGKNNNNSNKCEPAVAVVTSQEETKEDDDDDDDDLKNNISTQELSKDHVM